MKRQALIGIGLFVAAAAVVLTPAWANLRAPKRVDGFLSGSARGPLPAEALILRGEELRVVFPDFQGALSEKSGTVRFSVRYEIENSTPQPVTAPVKFLAVDIRDLAARLNAAAVPAELAVDPEEKAECLPRLARHRQTFAPGLYSNFLSDLRKKAGLQDAPDGEWISRLEKADLKEVNFSDLTPWGWQSAKAEDFRTAKLVLALKPGRNILEIAYNQRMFVEERDYGYFGSWPQKGFTGVDYLLYPAGSWPLAKDFRLIIRVEVPDYHHKVLFGTHWHPAIVRCSPGLKDIPADRKRVRFLEGTFAGIPADILTVLVWFDKKAVRHLAP